MEIMYSHLVHSVLYDLTISVELVAYSIYKAFYDDLTVFVEVVEYGTVYSQCVFSMSLPSL